MVICLERGAKWFAYGPADATATPLSLASLKSRMVLPFWCRFIQVVLEKRTLNGVIVVIFNYDNTGTHCACAISRSCCIPSCV